MLKRLGIPFLALAAMLTFGTPKQAQARVHFGVTVGAPPVYPYYQYCSPYDPYCSPYTYSYPYMSPYVYSYPQPYLYNYGWGWNRGGHEWREHERHEFREHHGGEHHRR